MTGLTLYEIEEGLRSLLDTEEMVPAEQRAEFERELAEAIERSLEKRERCGQFLRVCEAQASACEDEIVRLRTRRDQIEAAADRMRRIIARVIEAMGMDAKGRYPKLTSNTFEFSVRQNPPSVIIEDQEQIPIVFKKTTVVVAIDKGAIKKALAAGESVPGADLKYGELQTVIK